MLFKNSFWSNQISRSPSRSGGVLLCRDIADLSNHEASKILKSTKLKPTTMESSSQQYCLRWNNHRSNLLTVFEELLENEAFTDVTLAVDSGASVKCHKMVLAACSSYFQNLFVDLPCKHPIVVLKDVKHCEIKAILEYMYRGEVNVAQDQLGGLLKVAEVLKVKGLVDENGAGPKTTKEQDGDGPVETTSSPPPAISTSTATSSSAAHRNGHSSISPAPHSTDNSYNYFYGKHQLVDGMRSGRQTTHENPPLPVWPMSTGLPLSQHHPSSAHRQSSMESLHPEIRGGRNYEDDCEASASSLKRKFSGFPLNRDTPILRTVLGQGHADSSQPLRPDSRENNYRGNASFHETERRSSTDRSYVGEPAQSSHLDVSMIEDDDKQPSPQSYSADIAKSGIAGYMSAQKPEWKRYKQYTREDMMSAIDAVKAGMSALQAARKYGVPPRTLYDKVKKMGITTTRPLKRGTNGSGACFPYGIGGNANGSIYASSFYENENENNGSPSGVHENLTPSPALESAYVKWRDVAADSVHRLTEPPSPHATHPLVKQKHEEDEEEAEEEAQVEDLSVKRKLDLRVIVPPTTLIKEESNVSSDNFSNN